MTASAVVLTFNSESIIADTLNALRQVSDDIHVVDSFSTDRTAEIAKTAGAKIYTRAFRNYADQRNWAIDTLAFKEAWQIHMDADEILTPPLIEEIRAISASWPSDVDGFFMPRLIRFLGRDIRHGGYYPIYHMRLFRNGCGRVEERLYDQHFILSGRAKTLHHPFIDDHRMSLTEWVARHNNWATAESEEIVAVVAPKNAASTVTARLRGTPIEAARYRKQFYYRMPLFWRAGCLFFYKYIIRLGFLDGYPGLVYCFLQSFWFRFLVDAKIYERTRKFPALQP